MIRVNLLPIKKARRRSAGRTQLVVFAALLILQIAAISAIYMAETAALDELKDEVTANQQQVKKAEAAVESAKQLENKQKELQQQVEILDELEKKRTGPVRVLDEVQAMLSPPRNEEDRHAQSRKNWNVEWDTRRLWITSLNENEGTFEMVGSAVNADDVAEFLQRLTSADHFDKVQLDYVKASGAKDSEVSLVEFRVTGNMAYTSKSETDTANDGS
jgi:type IV pilus assembly protein PilN